MEISGKIDDTLGEILKILHQSEEKKFRRQIKIKQVVSCHFKSVDREFDS